MMCFRSPKTVSENREIQSFTYYLVNLLYFCTNLSFAQDSRLNYFSTLPYLLKLACLESRHYGSVCSQRHKTFVGQSEARMHVRRAVVMR